MMLGATSSKQHHEQLQQSMLRVRKDLQELNSQRLDCGQAMTVVEFQPDGDQSTIRITLHMTGGIYERGIFSFLLKIPPTYPFTAPNVICVTRVWHPNIDLYTGRVLLPILDKDWRPVLSVNTVVFALQLVFLEPNPEYPANAAASEALLRDGELFRRQVQETLKGGVFFGLEFPCHHSSSTSRRSGSGGSLKRKCHEQSRASWGAGGGHGALGLGKGGISGVVRSLSDEGGSYSECSSPPDSDLEAMCIQDEEQHVVMTRGGLVEGHGGPAGGGGRGPGVMRMQQQQQQAGMNGSSRSSTGLMMHEEEDDGGVRGGHRGAGSCRKKRPCLSPINEMPPPPPFHPMAAAVGGVPSAAAGLHLP